VQLQRNLSVCGVGGQGDHAAAVQEIAEAFLCFAFACIACEQWIQGVEDFGTKIQPLMKSRSGR
jgi:hypothetical protein